MKQLFQAVHRHSQHLVASSTQVTVNKQPFSLLNLCNSKAFSADNKKPGQNEQKKGAAASKPKTQAELEAAEVTPHHQRVQHDLLPSEQELFLSHINPDANARVFEEEKKYFDSLSAKDRLYYQAGRLMANKDLDDLVKDKNTWWGRIEAMTEDDMDSLPDEVLKKYQSIIIKGEEMQLDMNLLENQSKEERWRFVRTYKHLLTQEQKDSIQKEIDIASADKGQDRIFNYEKEGYMKRQPRFDLSKHSYNYEQFREFTKLYEDAWRKDRTQLTKFYKMVNYVKANPDSKDTAAVNFRKKYFIDLIEIPEEFKNETTESLDDIL